MPGLALQRSSERVPDQAQQAAQEARAEEEAAPSPADALRLTAFARWYPHHRSHAPRATVIDLAALQPDFIPWLESGSFVLPEEPSEEPPAASSFSSSEAARPTSHNADAQGDDDKNEKEEEKDKDDEEDEEEEDALPPPSFPALHAKLRQLIEKYDGAVFPKLNWSAPRDAAWIVPGATLRCTSPADIYLLLKSSDFVATDIAQARELYLPSAGSGITVDAEAAAASAAASTAAVPPLYLVIKQHYAFPTSHEFRCFVHRRRLVALSQRDTATAFPHLQPRATRRTIRRLVRNFWKERLDLAAPSPPISLEQPEQGQEQHEQGTERERIPPPTALLRDYVFDVYLTRDMGRVFLVDLAPWGIARTDPLLWNWDELERRSERWRTERREGQAGTEAGEDEEEGDEEDEEEEDSDEEEETDNDDDEPLPPLRILSSDPAPGGPSTRNNSGVSSSAHTFSHTPTYAHNMVPADFHALASASAGPGGAGKTLEQLREEWAAAVARASVGVDDGDEEED
ncbi:hypothetical protein OC842_004991 [Tilletia horrida]|uniref:Cell division cycle protein 123 n=1 Tax=Tilletia horrida TaxID=155126 RepID=A0AAN6G867_9BASI|nr:hypothetical protein OC842_004991 [Tilletia horrida]